MSFKEALKAEQDAGLKDTRALHDALIEVHRLAKAVNCAPVMTKEPVKEFLARLEREHNEVVAAQQKQAKSTVDEVLGRAVNDVITAITKDILKAAGLPHSNDNGFADRCVIAPRVQSGIASHANVERLVTQAREQGYHTGVQSTAASHATIERLIIQAREQGYKNGWDAGKKIGIMQGVEQGKGATGPARQKRWAAEQFDAGKKAGFIEGRKIGKEDGLNIGMEEGIREARENARKMASKTGAGHADLMDF
ncbi:hypothetical protein K491DRAFT_696654 [Lophiostoma macrostomum CBS 122681]|uniref:Essential protein Yae1 N-terminal domain-containing protein n=1 Tax=Lophiostoma macrostomum CBS 122681 TaxID=1314788 RepID=A0A6A6SW11_9PLEO|nr:hypothetical protein K491DRAFT_696654 [Lophiostoma macrostomum CBS 122681]